MKGIELEDQEQRLNELEALAKEQLQLGIGPLSLFLAGPLHEVKKLARQDVIVEGLGKLPCLRESGTSVLRFGKDKDRPADFTVWQHPRAPFGAVKVRIALRYEEAGVQVEGLFEALLAKMGGDAKSLIADVK